MYIIYWERTYAECHMYYAECHMYYAEVVCG